MALELCGECERCHVALAPEAGAYICAHECTFGGRCAAARRYPCPNRGGEQVRRPRPKPRMVRASGLAAA